MNNYTIIIPHKNIPHLLVRCLDSIPQYTDIQIIVADDNSNIIEQNGVNLLELPKKYPNVEFIFGKNENGRKGAGYARNIALQRAVGKYLVFADADDYFTSEIAFAMDKYKNENFDIVYFRMNAIKEGTNEHSNRFDYQNSLIDLAKNGNIDKLKFERVTVYGKFISLQLITKNNIYFQERKVANDVWFSMISAFYAQNIDISDLIIYCLMERDGSLEISKNFDRKKLYFDTDIDIYNQLKPYNLEKYFKGHIRYWWKQMLKSNVFKALFYYKKMINEIGK
jgi:glycosyltransferase involved in cell wall biosynthesis